MSALDTIALLKKADVAYFETGKPIMSDKKYDRMKEGLANSKLPAVQKYLKQVGATPLKAEVELEVYMPSLNKLKHDEPKGLDKWLAKVRAKGARTFLQSPKLDGTSLLVNYKRGEFISARTRGNGVIGRDVTEHARVLIKQLVLPKSLRDKKLRKGIVSVRCELVMAKAKFEKRWKNKDINGKKLKEARNAVNGFINSKDINEAFAKDLTVMALNVYVNEKEIVDRHVAVDMLLQQGFNTFMRASVADYHTSPKAVVAGLQKQIKKVGAYEYECDGLVIEVCEMKARAKLDKGEDNPDHSAAFKIGHTDLKSQDAQDTVVRSIEWNTSKTGANVPLVHYKPVTFGSTTNTKANGIHAANIIALGLGKGAKITVIRAGGVIPRIVKVRKAVEPKLPKKCECGAPTVMVSHHLYCSKPSKCSILAMRRLHSAINYLEVDGYGGKKVEQVYDAGFTDILSLWEKGSAKKLTKLDRWGMKAAINAQFNLDNRMRKAKLADLMVISGVFSEPGFSLASSRLEAIAKVVSKNPRKWEEEEVKKQLSKVKGLGAAAIRCFTDHIKDFKRFYAQYRAIAE